MNWKVSSYCLTETNCVEACAPWRTSTRSGETSYCVEVRTTDAVQVRDTKDRARKGLTVSVGAWEHFLAGLPGAGA